MTTHKSHSEVDNLLRDSKVGRIVEEAIAEDLGLGDVTTEAIVPHDAAGHADIVVKESGVIAGLEVASLVFSIVDGELAIRTLLIDGAGVAPGTVVASIDGSLASILKAERTALNFLQRMSGIATLTRKYVQAVEGTKTKITDTRKTAPGLRVLDKLAVRLGGGVNHRFGLDDMVLIKDNHIVAAGGIPQAMKRCFDYLEEEGSSVNVEVETTTLDEVRQAIADKRVDRVMLDNFQPDDIRKAVQLVRSSAKRPVEIEASGNVSLDNVRRIAEAGVDLISVGKLTHSPPALDISLDLAAETHA